jgi:hypothetical protein
MNHIDISMLEPKVNAKIKRLCKQSKFIEQEKVATIYTDHIFINVDLILLVGKMYHVKQMRR